MSFSYRLREARLQKGLTQEQLAHKIGVAKSTLTGYEKGNREPDVLKIKKISEVLQVDSDYLLGITHDSEQEKDLSDEIAEKYELLNDEYKKIVENLIMQLLETQESDKK